MNLELAPALSCVGPVLQYRWARHTTPLISSPPHDKLVIFRNAILSKDFFSYKNPLEVILTVDEK